MITREMLLSFCDDLSAWMVELGDTDLSQSAPHLKFPLRNNIGEHNEEEWEQLQYLTLWWSIKHNQRAPDHIETRMMLLPKGQWVRMYIQIIQKYQQPTSIWELAG